ncbi:TrmH family RNA methyltransferase [Candidatus Nomurabacteria bacterium]|nr:TrmH family RNA methyltransferase [Candidatus Nomurabacteria bacterium]
MEIHLVLNNLRSVYNTGSLFRTADAAGVVHIHLVGTTPAPTDRFGRIRKDFHKTALGAEAIVPWTYHRDFASCVDELQKKNISIIAIEQDEKSIPYTRIPLEVPLALVVGNEPEGFSPEDLALCDTVAEIPQYGEKESLNVAIAAGIVLFDVVRRMRGV